MIEKQYGMGGFIMVVNMTEYKQNKTVFKAACRGYWEMYMWHDIWV